MSTSTFALATLTLLLPSQASAQLNREVVFTHVNVIPINVDTLLPDQAVLVRGGVIREIGPSTSIRIPTTATVIDATGKFMIPALSDMHVHLEGDAWNIMFPAASQFSAEEINFEDICFLYIANGITTVDVLSALPEHLILRERIRRNEILGPRLLLSRMVDAAGKAWPPPICTWITNADEARKAVIDLHRQGYDRIKVYSFLDRESYDAIVTAAEELGMPVDGHIPYSTSVEYVLSKRQNMIAHVEEVMKFAKAYDSEQIRYYSSLIAKSSTWIVSALVLNRNLNSMLKDSASEFSKEGTEFLHPMASGIWTFLYQNRYRNFSEATRRALVDGYDHFQKPFVFELHKRGGKILIGTDALVPSTLPGFSLHEELEELVASGLTPYEALRIATMNTSEFLGELDSTGTIQPGRKANLVLLDENPLRHISATRKIFGVMTQNRWISKTEIDNRLSDIRAAYASLRRAKFQ